MLWQLFFSPNGIHSDLRIRKRHQILARPTYRAKKVSAAEPILGRRRALPPSFTFYPDWGSWNHDFGDQINIYFIPDCHGRQ
jgi:hypothetical protein